MKNASLRPAALRLAATFALSLPVLAQAFPAYLKNFSDHYDANGIDTSALVAKDSCSTCHVRAGGGGARNAYGNDFKDVTLGQGKGFAGLEFLDSDEDGFLNLEEIYAQTSPGKDDVKPQGRVALALDASGVLTVTVPSACAKVTLKAFGFQFDNGADASLDNVGTSATLMVSGSAGTVLARCDAEGFAGSFTK